jgi:hypothetical protein
MIHTIHSFLRREHCWKSPSCSVSFKPCLWRQVLFWVFSKWHICFARKIFCLLDSRANIAYPGCCVNSLWWMNLDIGTSHAEYCFPPSEAEFRVLGLHLDPSRTFLPSAHQYLKGCRQWHCPLGLYTLRTQNGYVLGLGLTGAELEFNMKIPQKSNGLSVLQLAEDNR